MIKIIKNGKLPYLPSVSVLDQREMRQTEPIADPGGRRAGR